MMIRVNLLDSTETRGLQRRRRALAAGVATLLLAAGALAAVNISQVRRRAALESHLTERQRTVDGLRAETEAVGELKERIRRQRERNQAVDAWLRRRGRHARTLRGLSETAPDRLWLTRYVESRGTTTLEGRAAGNEPIAQFLRRVSRVLKNARLVEVGTEPGFRRFVIQGEGGPPARAGTDDRSAEPQG